MVKITTQKNLVNPKKAKETSTRKTNLNIKVRGKKRNISNAIIVVVLIILPRSAIYPTTSGKRPDEAAKPSLKAKYYIDRENMIIEYNPNDVFGDQD
jgi:hypothetical protein